MSNTFKAVIKWFAWVLPSAVILAIVFRILSVSSYRHAFFTFFADQPTFLVAITVLFLIAFGIVLWGVAITTSTREVVGETEEQREASRRRNEEDTKQEIWADWLIGLGALTIGWITMGTAWYMNYQITKHQYSFDSMPNTAGIVYDPVAKTITAPEPPITGMHYFVSTNKTVHGTHDGVMMGNVYYLADDEDDVHIFIRYPNGLTTGKVKLVPTSISVPTPQSYNNVPQQGNVNVSP